MKATLFLNIAIANMKLSSYEGCCRCCNVVIACCNNPTMKLSDMGIDDDMTLRITIIEPVIPAYANIAVKALYRRGKCLEASGYLDEALCDFDTANRILPNTKCINDSINEINSILSRRTIVENTTYTKTDMNTNTDSIDNNYLSLLSLSPEEKIEVTKNGGPCWLRLGYWSQSISESRVYLPMIDLIKFSSQVEDGKFPSSLLLSSSWKVEFEQMQISIYLCSSPSSSSSKTTKECIFQENLEYNINIKDSLWMLESYGSSTNINKVNNYLVLYLAKVSSVEWFPGCEWWDRVFIDDEPIETITCSIDTDINQLPSQAREKAQKEYDRFSSLSVEAQQLELSSLSLAKKSFWEASEKTKEAADLEDNAIKEVIQCDHLNYHNLYYHFS
jgi:tetratricopeptide (TPR) repeat protein